jgi:hypothetical protein
MPIGSLYRYCDGNTTSLGDYTALDTRLAAMGGISARLFSSQWGGWLMAPSILSQSQSISCNSSNRSTPVCHNAQEDSCFHPLLKPIVRGRMRTQLGLIKGLPLASGSQDIKDRVRTAAIRDTGSSAKTMGVDRDWKPWLQDCASRSSEIRNAVVVRLFGVR